MSAGVQYLAVLGSTGSIGVNTLDVVSRHPERFVVHSLTASTNVDMLTAQCLKYRPQFAVMASEPHARQLVEKLRSAGSTTQVLAGPKALEEVASHPDVNMVMAAIVGAAGLPACMAAAKAGKRLLLANKEALVVGGVLFMDAVQAGGATLLPIDSEHSAIFQSLPDQPSLWASTVDKIILTASGGPFRTWEPQALSSVTPEQACAHPNWVMGRKISVDSATMMNKALEVIEARYLFHVAPSQIEVVIHPQSVIHSMVQFVDNSVVAQLGTPDMRGPIAYGLSWPERVVSGAQALDFSTLSALTFEPANSHAHQLRFPGLRLAWETLEAAHGSTAVLNAANEIAVAAFLDRKIRFDQIHHVNLDTLSKLQCRPPTSLEDVLGIDLDARHCASARVQSMMSMSMS
jgi:1-deoxy-D-xylulose-5-phosphate reductoisomerase